MGLTITQRFGANANFDSGTGTLTIQISDLTSVGLDSGNAADQIYAALVKLNRQNNPSDTNDPTLGVVVDEPRKRFTTINGVNMVVYAYDHDIRVQDNTTELDPDDVGVIA